MPIEVTTGGPIESIGPLIPIETPSFTNLVTAIADEIDDTTNEYNAQIQQAVFAAIRYCEREPYYFNQTRDITFPTVDGREFYDAADHPQIPKLVRIVTAYSEDSQGQRSHLIRSTEDEIETLADNSASRGEPYAFSYFAQRLRLYPIPGPAVYTIRLQLSPYRIAPITDASDSNAWTVEAFDMIKARAKYIIYKDILKEAAFAAEALNDYNDQHSALKAETSRRNGRGFITVTCF